MLNINLTGKTNDDLKRSTNEDTFVTKGEMGFCLVADGLGGAAAGELASRFFAGASLEVFQQANDLIEKNVVERIQDVFRLANEKIRSHVEKNPSHNEMGCTADLMALSYQGFVVEHLGDSRTYRFRDGRLKQLTNDHSLINNQIDRGLIAEETAGGIPSETSA